MVRFFGKLLVKFLSHPSSSASKLTFTTNSPKDLAKALRPGDVILVEGTQRFSTAIKYLTQSNWSHSALYVGPILKKYEKKGQKESFTLIEADIEKGVIPLTLSSYATMHTRICRPVNLSDEDLKTIIATAKSRIGHTYDLKNILDLARYLIPLIPIPTKWRRAWLELGSGDPTKAICSGMIAQLFQDIGYPILPRVSKIEKKFRTRHHSLITPSDFDQSPFFQVIKPTIELGFDYRQIRWQDKAE